MSTVPALSFPRLTETVAEREAVYRFMENERVDWTRVVAPHLDATARRCAGAKIVRVAHDTSFLSYDGDRDGLGPIAGKKRGFAVHASLAVTDDENRVPLGLAALTTFVRADRERVSTKPQKSQRSLEVRAKPRAEKESARWSAQARDAERRLGSDVSCIHVMDQEADDYSLLAEFVAMGMRFVVRGSAARKLDKETGENVGDRLATAKTDVVIGVPIGARRKPGPNHKARVERVAKLEARATRILLPRPQHAQSDAPDVHLNVVQVFEPAPPSGCDPIEWTLYTTEPIETAAQILKVVDHYRARWRIEEYFKSLKTGCAIEKRQLESYEALLRALAIFAPIAWRLLLVRSLAHLDDNRLATELFDDVQITVMNYLTKDRKRLLHEKSTIRDAYLVIASIGGHIRNNGEPGWIVLGRGFDDFVNAEGAWRAALATVKK